MDIMERIGTVAAFACSNLPVEVRHPVSIHELVGVAPDTSASETVPACVVVRVMGIKDHNWITLSGVDVRVMAIGTGTCTKAIFVERLTTLRLTGITIEAAPRRYQGRIIRGNVMAIVHIINDVAMAGRTMAAVRSCRRMVGTRCMTDDTISQHRREVPIMAAQAPVGGVRVAITV